MTTSARFSLAAALAAAGCATPHLDDPPMAVEMQVTGLRPDERAELKQRVCAIDGVTQCQLVDVPAPEPPETPARGRRHKPKRPRKEAVPSPEAKITFGYRGALGLLRYRIAELPHPGLEALKADVQLGYRGFDNKAPSIEVQEPKDGVVIAKKQVHVVVKVPDVDTATVDIGDEEGERAGELFSAEIGYLQEGDNEILIKAVDQAGNAREQTLQVIVDTTPPELQVEVDILSYDKAVVKGKVSGDAATITVDGREVKRDLFGGFEQDVAVDPDKTMCEVVAVDDHGNSVTIKRSVKIASPMSADSK